MFLSLLFNIILLKKNKIIDNLKLSLFIINFIKKYRKFDVKIRINLIEFLKNIFLEKIYQKYIIKKFFI